MICHLLRDSKLLSENHAVFIVSYPYLFTSTMVHDLQPIDIKGHVRGHIDMIVLVHLLVHHEFSLRKTVQYTILGVFKMKKYFD